MCCSRCNNEERRTFRGPHRRARSYPSRCPRSVKDESGGLDGSPGKIVVDNDLVNSQRRLREDGIELPLSRRLAPGTAFFDEVMTRHARAIALRRPTYRDPTSGYTVFTARFLADRGYCCASGCRHCPYEDGD